MNKKIYMAAGYNTISLGTGRKEFNPRKPRPGLEHYISEAGKGTLALIGGANNVDESVIGNFMAPRFNRQGHLAGFIPMIDEGLKFKPSIRVEAACASGGMALITGIKNVLAGADTVLTIGVEVQNSMKAIYGADVLAGAGWYQKRKNGHAYFFPGQFSDRAGAYFEKFGKLTPQDLKGLITIAHDNYLDTPVLKAIPLSNQLQKEIAFNLIAEKNRQSSP
jgi:acetyl-CoA C-acetyltransferase/acetyl-CoA acyltransferase